MTEHSDTNVIDAARTACLCAAGCTDYLAAVAVGTDGRETLVLASRDAIGDENARYDSTCADVEHEQPGPLPPRWRDRVTLAPLRCGRRTKSGKTCRSYVSQPGAACGRHRDRNTTTLKETQR